MTKTIKKTLLAILACLVICASGFAVFNSNAVSVSAAHPTGVAAPANPFEEQIDKLDSSDTNYSAKLTGDAGYYAIVYAAKTKYEELTQNQKDIYEADIGKTSNYYYDKYREVMAVFQEAIEFQELVSVASSTDVKMSNFKIFAAVTEGVNKIQTGARTDLKTWLTKYTRDTGNSQDNNDLLVAQWNEFVVRWNKLMDAKAKLDAVINKIGSLKYAEAKTDKTDWRASTNRVIYNDANKAKLFLPWDLRATVGYVSGDSEIKRIENRSAVPSGSIKDLIKTYGVFVGVTSGASYVEAEVISEMQAYIDAGVPGMSYYKIDNSLNTTAATMLSSNDFILNFNKAVADCGAQDARIAGFVADVQKANKKDTYTAMLEYNGVYAYLFDKYVTALNDELTNWSYGAKLYWEGEVNVVERYRITLDANDLTKLSGTYLAGRTDGLDGSQYLAILPLYAAKWAPIADAATPVRENISKIPATVDLTHKQSTRDETTYNPLPFAIDNATDYVEAFKITPFVDIDGRAITGADVLAFINNYAKYLAALNEWQSQFDAVDEWAQQLLPLYNNINSLTFANDYNACRNLEQTYNNFKQIIKDVLSNPTRGATKYSYVVANPTVSGVNPITYYDLYQKYIAVRDIMDVLIIKNLIEQFGDKALTGTITIKDWNQWKDGIITNDFQDIISSIKEANELYATLNANQKARLNVQYKTSTKTYKEVLDLANEQMAKIQQRINAFIDAVNTFENVLATDNRLADVFKIIQDEYEDYQVVLNYVAGNDHNTEYNANDFKDISKIFGNIEVINLVELQKPFDQILAVVNGIAITSDELADNTYFNDIVLTNSKARISASIAKFFIDAIKTRNDVYVQDLNDTMQDLTGKSNDYKLNLTDSDREMYELMKVKYNALSTASTDTVASQQSYVTEKYNAMYEAIFLKDEAVKDIEKRVAELYNDVVNNGKVTVANRRVLDKILADIEVLFDDNDDNTTFDVVSRYKAVMDAKEIIKDQKYNAWQNMIGSTATQAQINAAQEAYNVALAEYNLAESRYTSATMYLGMALLGVSNAETEFDTALTNLADAEAALLEALAAGTGVDTAAQAVIDAQAALDLAVTDLDAKYAVLTAPNDELKRWMSISTYEKLDDLSERLSLMNIVDATQKDLAEVEKDVAALSGKLDKIANELNALTGRVASLEGRVAALEDDFITLAQRVTDLETAKESIENELEQIKADISLLSGVDGSIDEKITELNNKIDKAIQEATAAVIKVKTDILAAVKADLESAVADLGAVDAEFAKSLKTLEDALEAGDVKVAGEAAKALADAVKATDAKIADLTTKTDDLQAQLDSVKTIAYIALAVGAVALILAVVFFFVGKKKN